MKLRAIIILVMIIVSLIPAYSINRFLQKKLRPRDSLLRFMAYLLSGFLLIFTYTLVLVLIIKWIFPNA